VTLSLSQSEFSALCCCGIDAIPVVIDLVGFCRPGPSSILFDCDAPGSLRLTSLSVSSRSDCGVTTSAYVIKSRPTTAILANTSEIHDY
jgi:hypothetical protein